jgi:hypothetical protein
MVLICIFAIAVAAQYQYNLRRRFTKSHKAFTEHRDLYDKLMELRDDPAMTDGKWKTWIPVCEYVDEVVRRNYDNPKNLGESLTEFVRREIE